MSFESTRYILSPQTTFQSRIVLLKDLGTEVLLSCAEGYHFDPPGGEGNGLRSASVARKRQELRHLCAAVLRLRPRC